MSNLRSDAREFAAKLTSNTDNLARVYIERLCYQIDQIEEDWHTACREKREVIDLFVAELEKVINQTIGIYPSEMKYKLLTELKYDINQTAKRMKGEG